MEKKQTTACYYCRVEGQNFFEESFGKQGFTDVVYQPWAKKKYIDGCRILVRSRILKLKIAINHAKKITTGKKHHTSKHWRC